MNGTRKNRGSALVVIIVTIAAALLIVGFTYITSRSSEEPPPDVVNLDVATVPTKKNNGPTFAGRILAKSGAPVVEFNQADYNEALKSDKLVVLYFYAGWGPLCKEEFPMMIKVFNTLSADRIIGFRVNFNDSSTDTDEKSLAGKFGVGYQHTKVILKNGQLLLKSPETWNEERFSQVIASMLENQ